MLYQRKHKRRERERERDGRMIVYLFWQFYSHCVTFLQNEYMDRWTDDSLESARARGSFCGGSRVPDDETARLLIVLQAVTRSGILRIDSNVIRYLELTLKIYSWPLNFSSFGESWMSCRLLLDSVGFKMFIESLAISKHLCKLRRIEGPSNLRSMSRFQRFKA